jgi:hypothetical protein
MLRERASGTYQVSSYFVSKFFVDGYVSFSTVPEYLNSHTYCPSVVNVISPIVFTIIVYPNVGFKAGAGPFFRFLAFMILDSMVG